MALPGPSRLVPEDLVYRRGILLLLTAARRTELHGPAPLRSAMGYRRLPAERSKNGLPNYLALGSWGCQLARDCQ